ncbi:Atu4866 domain-containing protein [Actinotalea sp. BY-33]|uniref:Atu4866 domain-containing protein n=1 Tax=Actinotalea soli TaxID=2819234 RepID=A0A939LQD1_9CELL|nr:Atu4866 domain-containing protein [Actinotalea soli]MBO1752099.1 Atu4866 domain-containing protein [Actinotalea soli]
MPVSRRGSATFEQELGAVIDRPGTPMVLAGATVRSLDPAVGDLARADVVVQDGRVTGVGPGLASRTPRAAVVDCAGMSVLPAAGAGVGAGVQVSDGEQGEGGGAGEERLGTVGPGSAATFVVLRGQGTERPLESVVWYPHQAAALVVDGVLTGEAGRDGGRARGGRRGAAARTVDSPHLGRWTDPAADVVQDLTPDGRYAEARGGRAHAYDGAFWIAGDHIVYRDDLGFWAYGRFRDGVLHHVDFRFHRT